MFKKKEGFTLVELLAVLVVLAIISTIGYVMITETINTVRDKAEIENARTLTKVVNDTIFLNEMNNTNINIPSFYVIEDDKEYILDTNGNRTETAFFKYNGKLCDYCTIAINKDKQVSIVLEGKRQDVIKEFSSNNVVSVPLTISREDKSLYNELLLFKDIYIASNDITSTKIFKLNVKSIVDENLQQTIYTLTHSSGSAEIKILPTNDTKIIIKKDGSFIGRDDNGNFYEEEDINSSYSEEILKLYDELKKVANKYISNNKITDEVYFEYENGVVTKKDTYGNSITSINMDNKLSGSGELKINSNNQISVTMYQEDYDIVNDYGSDKLYNKELTLPRTANLLFKNLGRLELLAEKYSSTTTEDFLPSKSDWLVFYYLRQLKYNSSNWDIVSGKETTFVTYVSNNATYLKEYFYKVDNLTVNGDTIDFLHMAAVMATRMYQIASGDYGLLDQGVVDSIASWAGDLQTFMTDDIIKKYGSDKTSDEYKTYILNNLGNSNTSFSMEDLYADMDSWIIYDNLCNDTSLNLTSAFNSFYTGNSTYSYKNRFTRFMSDDIFLKYYTPSNYPSIRHRGPASFDKTVKMYAYYRLEYLIVAKKWPLFENYDISTNLTNGVTLGFVEWMKNKAEQEQ